MKNLQYILVSLIAASFAACSKNETKKEGQVATIQERSVKPHEINDYTEACDETAALICAESGNIDGQKYFIRMPLNQDPNKKIKWVMYAPTYIEPRATPFREQVGWYFEELRKNGIAVVGVDAKDTFGSPYNRDIYEKFYQRMQSLGFEEQGCMILQSRGGLMGYNWIMDHPGRVKCVTGIYNMVTVRDYIGIEGISKTWNVTEEWLTANLSTQSPLERAQSLPDVKAYHIHGDADYVVRLSYNQEFINNLAHGELDIVPGLGHEFGADEFFKSQKLLDFILNNI